KVEKILGTALPITEIKDILSHLGLNIMTESEQSLTVRVPSYRFDIRLDVDLIEELARVHGYNRLPVKRPLMRMGLGRRTETRVELSKFKERLISLGYQEVITYSFVEPELMSRIESEPAAIALQ